MFSNINSILIEKSGVNTTISPFNPGTFVEALNKNNLKGRERAFYDELTTDGKAAELMTDETLRLIAMKLKDIVEKYATVDWSKKKSTQAEMRSQIKRLLDAYGYPPEYNEEATSRVISQAEYMM